MIRKRKPSHPGEILKHNYMEPMKLTVTKLAEHLRVSRKTVSEIINFKSTITADMALRLSAAFGTSPELWLNLQQTFNLWQTSHSMKEWKKIGQIEFEECP